MSIPRKKGEKYRCVMCRRVFVCEVDPVALIAKVERTSGEEVTDETHDPVCDPCGKKFLAWVESVRKKSKP